MDFQKAREYLRKLGLQDGQRASVGGKLLVSHAQWFNSKLQSVGSGDIEPGDVDAIFSGLAANDVFIAAYLQRKTIEELFNGSGPSHSDRILLFVKAKGESTIYQVLPLHWDEYGGTMMEPYGIPIIRIAYPEAVKLIKNTA